MPREGKMVGFRSLVSVEEALKKMRELCKCVTPEVVKLPLDECLGKVCAEDVYSPADVPALDRSAVDGYAVMASDTAGASTEAPVRLRVVGRLRADSLPDALPQLTSGEAVQVLTGAPIPHTADAVVMVEHTKQRGDTIEIGRTVTPTQNIFKKGEDYRRGELVVKKGIRIRPWHIAALASLNIIHVPVYRPLKLAVLSTGRELIDPGVEGRSGRVINTSKPMLKALIMEQGCEPLDLGTVGDDAHAIMERLAEGLEKADMVLVTGGTSVGETDVVPEAINSLGRPGLVVHGVRIKPGKPTGIGFADGKPIFMLPGPPVSTMISFKLFVQPAIEMLLGVKPDFQQKVRGRLTKSVASQRDTCSFVRVKVIKAEEGYVVEPLTLQGASLISTLTKANGILMVPEGVEKFDEGDEVEVELYQALEAAV